MCGFIVLYQFFQEIDTEKELVVISKPNSWKKHRFAISAIGLPEILRLKYGGYDIAVPAELQGFVKDVASHRAFEKTKIAESIGFTQNKNEFYNGEYIAPKKIPTELSDCLSVLFQTKQFKQILICSMMGLGAAYLDKKIVPVINIWGTGLNSEFLKTLILSPFGNPEMGYRDLFCKEKNDSKLDYDRNIIPVIADLRTYGEQKFGFEWSGDGYYIDGHGQFHAPLFIISKAPYFKDIHISIEIPMDISLGRNRILGSIMDLKYEETVSIRKSLLKHCGLLSFYIGRKLCSRDIAPMYESKLSEIMDERNFSFDEEKRSRIDALGLSMQQVFKSMFKFIAENWLFEWGGIVYEIDRLAKELYYKMDELINSNKLIISKSATLFNDIHHGFWLEKAEKRYLFLQEGAFNNMLYEYSESRWPIFDYWIDIKQIDNYRSNRVNQPYLKREFVGKDTAKDRKWFFVFCISDLEDIYPPRKLS